MVAWYTQLAPEQQAALQGIVVMAVFAVIKAACHYAGKPLGTSAAAKVGKLLAVAAATAGTTLVTTGATPAFWLSWGMAFAAAVGAWEAVAKGWGLTQPIADEES